MRYEHHLIEVCALCRLWAETQGVAREHAGLANVVQAEEEHDHTLQTDTSATVRGRTIAERLQIRGDVVLRDVALRCTLLEQLDLT